MARRFNPPREFYIPKGATKITHKASDAVAYIYENSFNEPCARLFIGKQSKPLWNYKFRTIADREKHITGAFAGRAETLAFKAAQRKERSKPHTLEVGHILESSWGYDQTNIDFYQVTGIIGKTMVELRPIAKIDASEGNEPWAQGKCLPDAGNFTGPTFRRKADHNGYVRIDSVSSAHVWDGKPAHWTAYA